MVSCDSYPSAGRLLLQVSPLSLNGESYRYSLEVVGHHTGMQMYLETSGVDLLTESNALSTLKISLNRKLKFWDSYILQAGTHYENRL